MNKTEVIQFFIADSAVLFFHVRIISRTPWTNFRYKGYFCRLIGQRQRITYLFAFTPGLCIIQVNGGSYSIKKNVFPLYSLPMHHRQSYVHKWLFLPVTSMLNHQNHKFLYCAHRIL